MSKPKVAPPGRERLFGEDELVVPKTDLEGRHSYTSDVFRRISRFELKDVLRQPHSIARHPGMPRSIGYSRIVRCANRDSHASHL